jgi:hypothetical protein
MLQLREGTDKHKQRSPETNNETKMLSRNDVCFIKRYSLDQGCPASDHILAHYT